MVHSSLEVEIASFEDSLVVKKFYVILVGVLSVTANSFVLLIMFKTKPIRDNPSNFVIFAILKVDLVFGFWLSYYWYHEIWRDGNAWHDSISFACFLILINLHVALSADRFWAICYPFSYILHKGTSYKKWVVLACSGHGLICGFVYAFQQCFTNVIELRCSWSLQYNLTYKAFFSCWTIICLSLLIVLNSSIICSSVRRRKLQKQLSADNSVDQFQTRFRQELRVANTIMLVIVSFLVCWSPLSVLYSGQAITRNYHFYDSIFANLFPSHDWLNLGRLLNNFSYLITVLNSLCDPLIFACRMKDINEAIKSIFTPKPRLAIEPERNMTTILPSSASIMN